MRMKSFIAVLLTLTMVFSVPGGVLAAAPQDAEPAAETTVEKETQAEQVPNAQTEAADKDEQKAEDEQKTEDEQKAKEDQKSEDSSAKESSGKKETEKKKTKEAEKVSLEKKTLDVNRDNYEITVSGMMPEDAELDVKEIGSTTDEYKDYIKDASKEVFKDSEEKKDDTLPYARFFDIKIKYADGEEFQPDNDLTLKIDTKDDTLKDEDLDFSAVHFVEDKDDADKYDTQLVKMEIKDKNEEDKEKEKDKEKIASMKADSFSVYGVVYTYTVDFYYTHEESNDISEHHMNGGSEMKLSDLFNKLGIEKDTKDISKVEFTDDSLVTFTKDGDDYKIKSLQPFTTAETLTITFNDGTKIIITVEDAVVRSGFSGSVRWEIDDAGLLTLKPDTREGISNPGMLGQNTNTSTPSWGWYRYNSEIKEIKVEPGVYTQANAVALFGSDNTSGVYPNLKKVDLSGLDISRALQLQRMFSNVKNLEEIDLSVMANKEAKNLYNINNLFNGCTNLKKVNLGGLTTRIEGVSGATNGCTMNNVFQGCNNLEEVDLSNVKLGGRTNGADGVQYWFEGKTKLTKVTMTNSQFPGMRYFDSMFEGCTALTELDMSNVGVSDAQYMRYMFGGCTSLKNLDVSGFDKLEKIVNMNGFVSGCTALENLNMDNLDNSAIGPYNRNHSITEGAPSSVGAREYGRELGIDTCKALKTLSAKNSKVWMVRNNRGLPGAEYYNAAEKSETYYFTTKQMKLNPDSGSEVTIASDRDYIDLITDRDGATNKHTTNPAKDPLPDAGKNINIVGGDKNTNGPGFLAPGAYTILDAERSDTGAVGMDDTYYRIAYVGSKPYKVDFPEEGIDDLKLINADGNNRTTICTRTMSWPTSGNKVIDCGSGIKITYENVAIDCNGKLHNVVVTINKITFKDLDKIPDTSKSLGGVPYTDRTHDSNMDGGKVLQPGQSYYRPVLQATEDRGIILFNYIYDGNGADPTAAEVGKKMLTGGSGTDIDFTIEIEKANDDTSFVFYAKDLDVASSQNWQYNSNGDACYDNLPVGNVTYGEGGEGFVLGKGVKENTVKFADHTGLYQDGKKVMTTGSDPNTSWSQFTVTADAKGSDFTWTSGIACTSYILENTKEQDLGSIEIQPKALKELTKGTLKADDFTFTLDKVSTVPDGMPEPVNESGNPITFPQKKKNDASGGITFDKMIFKTTDENSLIDGSGAFPYFPGTSPDGNTHGEGTHNTVTYEYKVKEVPGTDPDILEYDATEHTLEIKITTPENDTEMVKGIKAEIYVDGTLSKTVWSKEVSNPVSLSDLKFKNKKVDPVKVVIPAQKILQGRSWKDNDKFAAALTLTGEAGTPMPANAKEKEGAVYSEITIDNSGTPIKDGDDNVIGYKSSFGEITYELKDIRSADPTAKVKKFTYNVRELEPSETTIPPIPGITYDAAPTKVEVTVKLDETDPADPKLTAEVKYFNEDGDELTVPKFTNKYDAKQTTYKMEALKVLHKVSEEGMTKETLTGGEFDFILKPIGDNAAIAPMPKNTDGEGANRTYTKANESDGDIQFEVESDPDDGLVFNYQELLNAGITDDALHSDDGVDFEYEMYEVIPDGAVNNNDGTWTKTDNDGKVTIYDGVHHTRTITVKVRTNDNDTPSDPSDDFDELYILGHKDTHKGDFFINKDGEETPVSVIEGYDENANHFKEYDQGEEGDLGAPVFLNYTYKQPDGSIEITKVWDDADDQDQIRPNKVTVGIESDTEGVEVEDADIQGPEWKATVEELPVYKFDAKYIEGNEQKLEKIKYTVSEKEVAGYETTYKPDPAEFTFDESDEYKVSLEITNKHTPGQGDISGDETYGIKGEVQTGQPKYDVNPKNPVTPSNLVKPDKEGATISDDGKTVTIPGEGTYVLNSDGTISFTPDKNFIGDPTPVNVQGSDKQGNVLTATYTPHVVDPTDKQDATRTVHFTYESKTGKQVTSDVTQKVTLTRHAAEVDSKTGKVTKWGDWEPATFPAVPNPDDKVDTGWSTTDKVGEQKATKPGAVEDVYVIYKKDHYTVTFENGKHGVSTGGKADREYGSTPQSNKVMPAYGYKFTGEYDYVITDKTGKVIEKGKTKDPQSIKVTGNIVFTPKYVEAPDPKGPSWIEGSTVKSKDRVGRIQYGTLTFKAGDTPIDHVAFIDPNTGDETDAKSVDVYDKNGKKIGTYSLNSKGKKNADGSIAFLIKFTPVAGYTGKPPAITLRAYDKNLLYADGVYQPNVIGKEAKNARNQTVSKTSAKTGDEMPITLWLLLMSISGAAVIAGIFRRRKEH